MRALALAVTLGVGWVAACTYDPNPVDGKQLCSAKSECPDGYHCVAQVCRVNGAAGSGGGSVATGGSAATGGVIATGGIRPTGGVSATGGIRATGGVVATGGSPATGGIAGSGGQAARDAGTDGVYDGGADARTSDAPITDLLPAPLDTAVDRAPDAGRDTTDDASSDAAADAPVPDAGRDTAYAPCLPANVIDDMEDGNAGICMNQGRVGGWYSFCSPDASIVPVCNTANAAPSLLATPREGSRYAMHFTGSGFLSTEDYGALAMSVATWQQAYDASGFSGFVFWARTATGRARLRVQIQSIASMTEEFHGTCVPVGSTPCWDMWGATVDVTDVWTKFAIPFSTLALEGWGVPVSKDLSHLTDIQFKYSLTPPDYTVLNPAQFDVWIDDVMFY